MFKKTVFPFTLAIIVSALPFALLLTNFDYEGFAANNPIANILNIQLIANVTGLLGAVMFFWMIVIGNRFLVSLFTDDIIGVNKLHKWLGIWGLLLVGAHPYLIMFAYGENLLWLYGPPDLSTEYGKHIALGKLAIYLFYSIWISSFLARKYFSYRVWKLIHWLTYPMMALVFLHALDIGRFMNNDPVLQTYWYTLMVSFGCIVIARVVQEWGITKPKYTITSKSVQEDIALYQLTPKNPNRTIQPSVGQYVYLSLKSFGAAHPFSVMRYDPATDVLTFGIKRLGPFTQKMEQLTVGDELILDGPYGVFTKEGHTSDPKVIIAGGIGVTPFVELVSQYTSDATYMMNCNKDISNVIARPEFIEALGNRYTDCISRGEARDQYCEQGRISKAIMTRRIPADILSSAQYFVCGSPAFNNAVRAMLQDMQIEKKRIHIEDFSM